MEGEAADDGRVEDLLPAVYEELRRVARRERFRLSGGDTLTTTALIHEAYLRLARSQRFASRADFLRLAAVAMRRILVDRVRTQLALKRGGGRRRVELEDVADFLVTDGERVLAVHEALQRLSALNPRLAGLVECRFFAGYSEPETAEALGVSERTVQRDWTLARAWLRKELGSSGPAT
jgi:RNA polymerase sigma factor (TIGR02999 family)